MTNLVVALGNAGDFVQLIHDEVKEFVSNPDVLNIRDITEFSIDVINQKCKELGGKVVAYVLPPESESEYYRILEDADDDTSEDVHDRTFTFVYDWKQKANELLPSISVKELQVCPYVKIAGKYWLDGVRQFVEPREFVA